MATAPSPNDLTRQQLDELDALLQKMLTVPLAVDAPPPAASLPPMAQPPLPPSWRIDPPQIPDGFGGTPRSTPQPPPAAPPSRAVSFAEISLDDLPASLKFEPPAPAPVPKAAKPVSAPAPAPAPKPVPPPVPVPKAAAPVTKVTPAPKPVPAPKAVPVTVTPAPPMPPVPLLFLPFVALEGLFDNICGMFGPLGRLFRSGFFKYLYGFAGLGLVVYTALHVAQVQGWFTLPTTLPWPK